MSRLVRTIYPTPLRWLHWLMAGLIAVAWFIGDWAVEQEGPAKGAAIGLHIAVASGVLVFVLLRLALRAGASVPGPLPSLPARLLAQATHLMLYALMVLLPVSGWLAVNTAGRPFVLMKLLQMPSLVGRDPAWHGRFETLHILMAWALACLVVLHVLAAAKHHWVDRDYTLARMVPRLRRR
ncbi:cytochrome b [Ideonella sp.]|uniref:cytochrome b n=1 Tax=Ideonella sp. TaxID=1929293 RepID=UPI002B460BDF|nr:cytochrome b [Ideonella sp.]HJV68103.1 cytochrome b [Ideonella sp.]